VANGKDSKQWTARWLLGGGLLIAILGVALALAPITYSTESDSCGSAWSPDYPDRALNSQGGCGYWLTLMTRVSLGLLAVGLVLVAVAAWKLLRVSERPLRDSMPVT
jgi:hypothetical protein